MCLPSFSWANWWTLSERTHHVIGKFFMGTLMGTFKKNPTCARRVFDGQIDGHFYKELIMGLVGSLWANWFRTHNELTMYPLGKYSPAPSVNDYASLFPMTIFSFCSILLILLTTHFISFGGLSITLTLFDAFVLYCYRVLSGSWILNRIFLLF